MAYYRIQYNNFLLPFVKSSVTETPVWASDNITREGTEYQFTFSGFLTAGTTAEFETNLEKLKCALIVSRQELSIQWSDDGSSFNTLYDFLGSPEKQGDMAFGPLPGPLVLDRFYNGRAALYSWTVRVFQKTCFTGDCDQGVGTGEILSITRRYQFDIDASGMTTRVVSGVLTVRSTLVDPNADGGGIPADNYRFVVTPAIPIGFQREGQSFSQSEDGRHLTFSFRDVEHKYVLPSPITSGNASFSINIDPLGFRVNFTLSGVFSAPPSIPKAVIVNTILLLAVAKFPQQGSNGTTIIYDKKSFLEDVYENRISFSISGYGVFGTSVGGITALTDQTAALNPISVAPPTGGTQAGGQGQPGGIPGLPANSSSGQTAGQAYQIFPYGGDKNRSSGVIADPPFIYDECATGVIVNVNLKLPTNNSQGFSPNSGKVTNSNNQPATNSDSSQIPSVNVGPSAANKAAPYVAYHEVYSWEIDNGIKVFAPKVKGINPIVQQVHLPQVTFIQAGYSQQVSSTLANVSPPPTPLFTSINAAVLQMASVSPAVPDPIGDGSYNRYTTHWRYVMRLSYDVTSTANTTQIYFPPDPRRASTTGANGASNTQKTLLVLNNLGSLGLIVVPK